MSTARLSHVLRIGLSIAFAALFAEFPRHSAIAAETRPASHAITNEPLFFSGDSKTAATANLLRAPSQAPHLTSADGAIVFEAGRDFVWQPGSRALTLTVDSHIPFKTTAELHPPANSPNAYRHQRGSEAWMFFGPGRVMHDLQCLADYSSDEEWQAPPVVTAPDSQLGALRARLRSRQPVRFVMLGDSISTGADASAISGVAPLQPGYPDLVARGLEQRFGGKVALTNLSVSGMDSNWGLTRMEDVIADKPDLVLIAFGMNDASGRRSPEEFSRITREMAASVRTALPECAVLLVSSMTANSEWVHAAPDLYPKYADALAKLAGPGIAFANATERWTAIEGRKKHMDLSGNGLNHPNDYGHRLYAEVILSVIGRPL
ncbi:MAG: SGNH/GDSL hydrolase family protein [Verrucomicrobia bacterium]|nr:SGNH/GDSL hydrolase family protein [Verrucomicrobiota bacterium]MBI3868622.1 SGNH/GDSL hydrolase family protein [Verrucomicrobiota bacterium]